MTIRAGWKNQSSAKPGFFCPISSQRRSHADYSGATRLFTARGCFFLPQISLR
jgi:hypothetical protein